MFKSVFVRRDTIVRGMKEINFYDNSVTFFYFSINISCRPSSEWLRKRASDEGPYHVFYANSYD